MKVLHNDMSMSIFTYVHHIAIEAAVEFGIPVIAAAGNSKR